MLSTVTSGMVRTTVSMMETVTVVGAGGASLGLGPAPTAGVVPSDTAPGGDACARVGLAVGAFFAVGAGTLRIFEWLHLPRSMFNRQLLK